MARLDLGHKARQFVQEGIEEGFDCGRDLSPTRFYGLVAEKKEKRDLGIDHR